MSKLRTIAPMIRAIDARTTKLPPKQPDAFYTTPEFRWWRAEVMRRAGGRCEASDNGHRCSMAAPEHRMYADHIVELRDGGAPLDFGNGQCLCHTHHERKKITERIARLQR